MLRSTVLVSTAQRFKLKVTSKERVRGSNEHVGTNVSVFKDLNWLLLTE